MWYLAVDAVSSGCWLHCSCSTRDAAGSLRAFDQILVRSDSTTLLRRLGVDTVGTSCDLGVVLVEVDVICSAC